MSYSSLARKYRPQTFEELVGQPHVRATLTRALASKRTGQAYLFAGMRGVGKTSAARLFAKCLNCEKGPSPRPCNKCSSCAQITQGNSLDVIEIDGASNRGIDEIRNLRESVPFAPTTGAYRIYIIDEVHMLTTEAFNALLKTLEEPPAHVKFVFATTAADKLPATVLSRCQRFDFRYIELKTIVETLGSIAKSEKIKIDKAGLYAVARSAEGSLRDAEVVLEQLASFVDGAIQESDVTELLGSIESEALFEWVKALLERDAARALEMLRKQLEQGKEPLQLLNGLLRHIRNLLVIRSTEKTRSHGELTARLIDEPAERIGRLREQAEALTAQELLVILQLLHGAYELTRRSPTAQMVLELVVIKVATREEWQSISEITQQLKQLGAQSPAQGGLADSIAPAAGAPESVIEVKKDAAMERSASSEASISGGASLEAISALWPGFLERLGQQKMSLAAYLAHARPLRFDSGQLTIGLIGSALHEEVLAANEHRRLIERLLSELCKIPVTVLYETLPESAIAETKTETEKESTPQPAPQVVQNIVKLFNATILDQPPQTTP